MAALTTLASKLSKIDPNRILAMLPKPQDKEKFEAAKSLCVSLLGRSHNGRTSTELLDQLDKATNLLQDLYANLADSSELGAKARLNQAVYLAESGQLERSIYLAGVARERNLREPYRTQLKCLAAHACLFRYRQAYQVDEWIKDNLEDDGGSRATEILRDMSRSYLMQLNYFATEAYASNRTHPLAAYHKLIASLLLSQHYKERGREAAADEYAETALTVADAMAEPSGRSHYMILNYHMTNHAEFSTFVRLSSAHDAIRHRLEALGRKATSIDDGGGGRRPADAFTFAPYVAMGARGASLLGVVCLSAAAFGLEIDDVQRGMDAIWDALVDGIRPLSDTALALDGFGTDVAMNTGGGARAIDILDSGTLFGMNTGGAA